MEVKIHGIIQRYRGCKKIVELVISRDETREKQLVRLADDLTVNDGTIRAGLKKRLDRAPDNILIPRHIKAVNLRQEPVR